MAEPEFMSGHPSGLPKTETVPGEECEHARPVETLYMYLKLAEECVDAVQKIPSRKFNNEQCEYLAHKLKVVVQSASSFLQILHSVDHHGSCSFGDVTRWVSIFKLLLALAKEIESFIQGCCKDAWIQAAMTLTNVTEYISSVGFKLELCRVAFCKDCAAVGSLTLDQVDDINKAEVEVVEKKASMDVETLFEKVILELNSLRGDNRDLASYLLQRLKRIKPIPASLLSGSSSWSFIEDGGLFGKLFKRVQQTTLLGRGASATVHKAMWLGTEVAKKTFQGRENPDFIKEVDILARLCHPNITSMFCCTMDKRSCSIIMELMDEDLHDLMHKRCDGDSDSPPFSILEGVDIMLQVGEGVNYLHNQRIVHRDLKSMNILVKSFKARESEIGYIHAKVADFGLSKTKESSTRFSSQTFNTGTNRWMPPEIINLGNMDSQVSTLGNERMGKFPFKCDVYSFGMVCYEILTGYQPFPDETYPKNVKEKVMRGERPDLPNYCPPELKALIRKCWNQVPRERPSFADICLELKYLKCLLMTGFNQGPHLTIEDPLQAATEDSAHQVSTNHETFAYKCGIDSTSEMISTAVVPVVVADYVAMETNQGEEDVQRRLLKEQRQKAILREFAAKRKTSMEHQDVSDNDEDSEEGSPMKVSNIVDETFDYKSGIESTSKTLTKAVVPVGETDYVAMETSSETKECVLCRRKKDDKNSSMCWIALVQRYNFPCQVLNRGKPVANVSDVGPVPMFGQFHEGNMSDEGLDQLVTVGFPDDSGVATAIDFSTVQHVQCCGHQMHFDCFQGHMTNLQLSIGAGRVLPDPSKLEFSCPTCRRFANVLLPDVDAYLSSRKHDMHEDGKDETETGMLWSRFWQSNKNLERAVHFFCCQVLRVQEQSPGLFIDLRSFEISQALWEGLVLNVIHCEVETRDGFVKGETASSSSAPNELSDECTWGGDAAHWIALRELGRLAILSNTLPGAVQEKDRMLRRLRDCLGLLGTFWRETLLESDTGSETSPNGARMSELEEIIQEIFPHNSRVSVDPVLLDLTYYETNMAQDQKRRSPWVPDILKNGVLTADPFRLLTLLLIIFNGQPDRRSLHSMVKFAYTAAVLQAYIAFTRLGVEGAKVESFVQRACLPFLRRAAILVQIITREDFRGRHGLSGSKVMEFISLQLALQLPDCAQILQRPEVRGSRETLATQLLILHQPVFKTFTFGLLKVPPKALLHRLPHVFQELLLENLHNKKQCSSCGKMPADPAICLICGMLLCCGTECCRSPTGIGECSQHAADESAGVGIFLLLRSAQLLLLRNNRACMGALPLYVGEAAEEDLCSRRNKLLFLSDLRLNEVRRLWMTAAFDFDSNILRNSYSMPGRY